MTSTILQTVLDLWAEDKIASGEIRYILNMKILPCKGPQIRTSCALIPPHIVTCGRETSFFLLPRVSSGFYYRLYQNVNVFLCSYVFFPPYLPL